MSCCDYHVRPHDCYWSVTSADGGVLALYETKFPAIVDAQLLANANRPARLVIHDESGANERELTFGWRSDES